jgi:HEAT repeat protein
MNIYNLIKSAFKPNISKLEAHKNINGLIKCLSNKDETIRNAAMESLGKLRELVDIKYFIAWADDKNPRIREKAIPVLVQASNNDTIELIVNAMKDQDAGVRSAAEKALIQIGVSAINPLITAFKGYDKFIRQHIISLIGKMNDSSVIDVLIDFIKIPEFEDIRDLLIEELTKFNDPRVLPTLINALGNQNETVREKSIKALVKFKNKVPTAIIINALKDTSSNVRSASAYALGIMNCPEAMEKIAVLAEAGIGVSKKGIEILNRNINTETPLNNDTAHNIRVIFLGDNATALEEEFSAMESEIVAMFPIKLKFCYHTYTFSQKHITRFELFQKYLGSEITELGELCRHHEDRGGIIFTDLNFTSFVLRSSTISPAEWMVRYFSPKNNIAVVSNSLTKHSSNRLTRDKKNILHELGHIHGLGDCSKKPGCVMVQTSGLKTLDFLASNCFCQDCMNALQQSFRSQV